LLWFQALAVASSLALPRMGIAAPVPKLAPKSAHLLWSEGTLRNVALNYVGIATVGAALQKSTTCAAFAAAVYAAAQEALLRSAHRLQWWTALSLLSSSCCVVQLGLNAASVGCAGFNTWLGPLRAFFLAVTLHARLAVRGAAGASITPLAKANALGLALSAVLTLLPEIVAVANQLTMLLARARAPPLAARRTCVVSLPSMGCAACVGKVLGAVGAIAGVVDSRVTIGEATIRVADAAETIDQDIWDACNAAGFEPSELTWRDDKAPVGGEAAGGGAAAAGSNEAAAGGEAVTGGEATAGGGAPLDVLPAATMQSAVAAGLLASSCCAVQVGVNALSALDILHVGCAGFNTVLGPHRATLRAATAAWLGWRWVASRRADRPKLLRATVVCAALTFLPELLRLSGGPAIAPSFGEDALVRRVYRVDGLGCEACEQAVRSVLQRLSGVVSAVPDFHRGVVEIVTAPTWAPFDEAAAALLLDRAGYPLLR